MGVEEEDVAQLVAALEATDPQTKYEEAIEKAMLLQGVKDMAYGTAWVRQGWVGNIYRILSKADRLREMLMHDTPAVEKDNEAVSDTLLDLINLSAFAYVNFCDGNRWGNDACNQLESIGRLLAMARNQDPNVGPELERLHERLAAYMRRWEMTKEASPAVAALVAEMMPDPYPEQP